MGNKATRYLEEELIERSWAYMREFAREVMDEFECEGLLPIEWVLFSTNVMGKWLNWARMN